MSAENGKWKGKLLSSSLPLEYEAGKILTENGFHVIFDYAYKRHDNQEEKEFSIDIKAGGFFPFEWEASVQSEIDFLIECKYRNPNTSWLFLKDVNPEINDYRTSRGVIKVIDDFTEVHSKNSYLGALTCERCVKGVEVNLQSGDVHSSDISHGISQLVYSLPSIIREYVNSSLYDLPDDIHPKIICPILLTTAPLRILNADFSISKVEGSNNLNDISVEVPYLKMFTEAYPSFKEHCRNLFIGIPDDNQTKRFEFLKYVRQPKYDSKREIDTTKIYSQPSSFLANLIHNGDEDVFREVLVCNLNNFKDLIDKIKSDIEFINNGFELINSK